MAEWVKVREYATKIEADIALARLHSAQIPGTIKSHEGGIFGAGFQGPVTSGVDLSVPKQYLKEAEKVLADS